MRYYAAFMAVSLTVSVGGRVKQMSEVLPLKTG